MHEEAKASEEPSDSHGQSQSESTDKPKKHSHTHDKGYKDEQIVERDGKQIIVRKGKILNENGEWEEYIEEDDPERPPIAYTYMAGPGLEIESDDEVVDFCMQYRIPKIEGLEKCKNLKVSSITFFREIFGQIGYIQFSNFLIFLETWLEKEPNKGDQWH